MPKFRVNVTRIGYANMDIEVEADTPELAEDKALSEAGDQLFSEHSSEYQTNGVTVVPNR